jgi:ATP-dependent DNA helicase RecQ
MTEDHSYKQANDDAIIVNQKGGNAADDKLFILLKAERKKVADKLNLPPFVIFQDPSLEDMSLKYPITISEMANVHGVGEGKAKKYGEPFVKLISTYVDENDVMRPDDFVVKSTGTNSALKLYIITNVDKKLPLSDIADAKKMEMIDLIKEMEAIVNSGTKLNISYALEEILDEDQQEEIHDYFLEDAETDDIETAMEEFDGDYEEEELRLYRLKFFSEVAN